MLQVFGVSCSEVKTRTKLETLLTDLLRGATVLNVIDIDLHAAMLTSLNHVFTGGKCL